MIKIIIADDHSIVREGLKQIIADTPDMTVCDEACDGNELIQKVLLNKYDVVVLDITMPGTNVLDVLKQIKRQLPAIQVLVLSMHPEEQYAVRVLKAGASGYLTKESAPSELVKAIRKVSQGRKYISPSFAENLADILLSDHDQPAHATLSDREYQVLCMIASGETIKNIAENLFLSEKTISTYRSRILQKMNMKNNAGIIHYAIKNMLVQ
ncbi:MAG: response regulator transcription factor [Desulfobacteraceae bacterium]|nr:response regulator transcription factor [Desulfobacteraceae bacterium]MBC2754029.1 response regulator transcription factor [Desulfobacteraceae bacterium]